MTTIQTMRYRAALHEMGHALVGESNDIHIRRVTIDATGGGVCYGSGDIPIASDCLAYLLAGAAAEAEFGYLPNNGDRQDRADALNTLRRRGWEASEHSTHYTLAADAARQLVRDLRPAIERGAKRLYDTGEIGGMEIRSILADHHRRL